MKKTPQAQSAPQRDEGMEEGVGVRGVNKLFFFIYEFISIPMSLPSVYS